MSEGLGALAALRRRARRRAEEEHCDLCAAPIPTQHPHLLEMKTRQLACACATCAILFPAQANARFKEVPREVRPLPHFSLTDAQWDALMIPINIAFFLRSSAEGKIVAYYPSPAGAMESLLDVGAWDAIAGDLGMRDDVEALVVNRLRQPHEYYILPIDSCYRLVGMIRVNWRGLSGGEEVQAAIEQFFDEVRRA